MQWRRRSPSWESLSFVFFVPALRRATNYSYFDDKLYFVFFQTWGWRCIYVKAKMYIRKGWDVYMWRRRCIYVKVVTSFRGGRDGLWRRTWRIMVKDVTDYGERGNGFRMDLIIFFKNPPNPPIVVYIFSAGICFLRGRIGGFGGFLKKNFF